MAEKCDFTATEWQVKTQTTHVFGPTFAHQRLGFAMGPCSRLLRRQKFQHAQTCTAGVACDAEISADTVGATSQHRDHVANSRAN